MCTTTPLNLLLRRAIIMLAILFPLHLLAQDITGVWKGTITTTEKSLPYELAISEADGKLTGYSYIRFVVNGKELTAVKSIKVKNDGGQVTVTDDELIYDNFTQEAPKDVIQVSSLVLKTEGEIMTMAGTFKTKKTRQYRILSGQISVQKTDSTTQTALVPKLDSLKLLNDLSFRQPEKKPVFATVVNKPLEKADLHNSLAKDSSAAIAKTVAVQQNTSTRKIIAEPVVEKPTPAPPPVVAAAPPPVVKKPQPVVTAPPPVAVVTKPPVVQKPVAVPKPVTAPPVAVIAPPKPAPVYKPNVTGPDFTANLAKRSIETIKTLEIKTDSLTLTLYDNGEVDGDTVSVIMNGKMLMAKQGLSTNAINKTIYITPDMGDSIQLVMYAENLGSLPPNTGLLIIRDGNERYEIRFSGDLTKNAGITLRRRKQ